MRELDSALVSAAGFTLDSQMWGLGGTDTKHCVRAGVVGGGRLSCGRSSTAVRRWQMTGSEDVVRM